MKSGWIEADWAAPLSVRALCTTRVGGVSTGVFAGLNLATHVDDDPMAVAGNRTELVRALELPNEPRWLNQVHGRTVAEFGAGSPSEIPTADAAVTREAGVVLAVLTADCLPVLLAARDGSAVGIAHAGWRGLAGGVIEATVAAMSRSTSELVAWLAPAIGAANYEVDATVRDAFAGSPGFAAGFTASGRAGHWFCDLAALARVRLAAFGVIEISGGAWDTFANPERFYSFRRDGKTGRMASLIWIEAT